MSAYGFTLDYFAELLHLLRSSMLPQDPASRYQLLNAKSRDIEAINRLVRGFMKLLHPDGKASDAELTDYLKFAVECRQRVKDQLSAIAPGEYPESNIQFKIGDVTTSVPPPERGRRKSVSCPSEPSIGKVVGLATVGGAQGTLQLIEVVAQKGHGGLHRLGLMSQDMKESVKAAYDFVSHNRKNLHIMPEFKDGYDLSLLALPGAVKKEGPSAGLAFAVGIVSVITQRKVRNDVAMTGEITLHGSVLAVGGLAQKISAARAAGCRAVILPKENEREVSQFPEDISKGMRLIYVEKAEEAFKEILL
jgi:ATP-dependent Lon protease